MRHILIVANPVAGRGKLSLAEQVAGRLRDAGCHVDLYFTTCAGDATAYVRALAELPDVIAVAGGDGTVNEVVNGLKAIANDRFALALIPSGTTNVLAMELGIRRDAGKIAAMIEQGKEKAVWPGSINGRRFMLMAGVGYDAWVVDNVDTQLKKRLGKLAYVWSMLKQLRHFGRKTYRVTVDGKEFCANSVIMTNGRFYGGSFVISKQADLSRPETQVLMMSGKNPLKLLFILLGLPLGIMEKMPGIVSLPARRVDITMDGADGHEPVQADGDSLAHLPLSLMMDEQPLRVLVP